MKRNKVQSCLFIICVFIVVHHVKTLNTSVGAKGRTNKTPITQLTQKKKLHVKTALIFLFPEKSFTHLLHT